VILNVHREFFEYARKGRKFELFFKYYNPITEISTLYSEVPVGEAVCLFNSANYLEIAINMGNAASQLDLMKDETIQIKFLDK
jgi:S-adenosylmethionine hydrolase